MRRHAAEGPSRREVRRRARAKQRGENEGGRLQSDLTIGLAREPARPQTEG
jgi:hypothetical protein